MIPYSGYIEAYPPVARERLRELQSEARAAGIEWPAARSRDDDGEEEAGVSVGVGLALLAAGLLGPGLWLLGVATAVYLIVEALT